MKKALLLAAAATLSVVAYGHGSAILTNEIYNTSGSPGNYTNASSIPVTTSGDLLLNQSAVASNYVGNNEAAGGTTAPFTDGLTATDGNLDVSQSTRAGNALFDLNAGPQPWYVEYQLPSSGVPNGYDLTGVTLISGHQDSRVNQQYDILVSSDGVTFTSLSDGSAHTTLGSLGAGFAYNPSNGNGGAASSTVSPSGPGALATNVKFVEFVDNSNGGNDIYRELAAYGTASTPEPGSLCLIGLGTFGLLSRRRKA